MEDALKNFGQRQRMPRYAPVKADVAAKHLVSFAPCVCHLQTRTGSVDPIARWPTMRLHVGAFLYIEHLQCWRPAPRSSGWVTPERGLIRGSSRMRVRATVLAISTRLVIDGVNGGDSDSNILFQD